MNTIQPASLGDRRYCEVCDERTARWTTAGGAFAVCDTCRAGEPCRRCGVERDDCKCAAGPDVASWLPLAAEG